MCIINAKYVDVVIATYNLVEYTDNNPIYESFKFRAKIRGKAPDDGNNKIYK